MVEIPMVFDLHYIIRSLVTLVNNQCTYNLRNVNHTLLPQRAANLGQLAIDLGIYCVASSSDMVLTDHYGDDGILALESVPINRIKAWGYLHVVGVDIFILKGETSK